jgi:hypothetical protein
VGRPGNDNIIVSGIFAPDFWDHKARRNSHAKARTIQNFFPKLLVGQAMPFVPGGAWYLSHRWYTSMMSAFHRLRIRFSIILIFLVVDTVIEECNFTSRRLLRTLHGILWLSYCSIKWNRNIDDTD